MMLMMLAGRSENRRRDYADDFRFLRHLPSESMTMMLMMLVLFVCDHLCTALVRLAASRSRALFQHADDAAFLDRLSAKIPSGQHGTIMHLGRQRPQASTPNGLRLLAASKRASSASSSSYFGQKVSKTQHHQHRFLSVFEHKQQATSAASAFHSAWQMVRNVSIRSMTFLVASHLHTSRDDADDARWSFRKRKRILC